MLSGEEKRPRIQSLLKDHICFGQSLVIIKRHEALSLLALHLKESWHDFWHHFSNSSSNVCKTTGPWQAGGSCRCSDPMLWIANSLNISQVLTSKRLHLVLLTHSMPFCYNQMYISEQIWRSDSVLRVPFTLNPIWEPSIWYQLHTLNTDHIFHALSLFTAWLTTSEARIIVQMRDEWMSCCLSGVSVWIQPETWTFSTPNIVTHLSGEFEKWIYSTLAMLIL